MKAALIVKTNKIVLSDVKKPDINRDEVLVKVKRVGICGTDLGILKGNSFLIKDGYVKYPIICGHEWSGIVTDIGEEVENVKVGDRVTGDNTVSCGKCIDCMSGNYNICKFCKGVGTLGNYDGAFAEFIKMPERYIYKISENVSFDVASLTEPGSIAGYAVQKACIKPGDIVVVHGTGAIGLFAVQYAKISGAAITILTGRKNRKLQIGKEVGADIVINVNEDDLKKEIFNVTNERGVDSIIEASGSISALVNSFDILRAGGRISVVSFFESKLKEFDIDKVVLSDMTLCGSAGSPGYFTRTLQLMSVKRLICEPIITHKYKFEEIESAMKAMVEQNDRRIKIIIEMD